MFSFLRNPFCVDVVPSAAVIYNDIDSLSYFAAIDNDLSEQLYNISSTCGGFGAFRSAVLTSKLRKDDFLFSCHLSFVQMFNFTERGAVGSADIHFAKGIFCVNVLYLLSECLILLGAGRECEGKKHREREDLA